MTGIAFVPEMGTLPEPRALTLAEDVLTHDIPEPGQVDPEYLYGRVAPGKALLAHILNRDGAYLFDRGNELGAEMIFYKYARTRNKAMELPKLIRQFAHELNGLALDLEEFIQSHQFPVEGSTEGEREHERPA